MPPDFFLPKGTFMKVMLNKDKHGMLFIDGLPPLTFDEPGPVDVDVQSLTPAQFNQLSYNLLRGAIAVDKPEELGHYARTLQPVGETVVEEPVTPAQPKEIDEVIEDQQQELKKLLTKTVSTIKKSVPAMRAGELRKLLELEKSGKNRKSLVQFLDEACEAHANAVTHHVGDEGIDLKAHAGLVKGGLGLRRYSQNLTDVVDSEEEEVTIKTTAEED
jgi:hypothetical protein